MCHKLLEQDSQELRAETKWLIRKARTPRANITGEEKKTLRELKEDKDGIVLTVDKGVAMVASEKKEYLEKTDALLAQPAYRTIDMDPTNMVKTRLIQTLRRIKSDTNIAEGMYRTLYPTGCTALKFYGLPMIH